MHAKLLQSCPTLCDPIDGSPPGSSVHRILQARILEWVAVSFSKREPTIYFKIFICPCQSSAFHSYRFLPSMYNCIQTALVLWPFLVVAPLFLSLATPHGMGDLSSPAVDWTHTPALEASSLSCWTFKEVICFFFHYQISQLVGLSSPSTSSQYISSLMPQKVAFGTTTQLKLLSLWLSMTSFLTYW